MVPVFFSLLFIRIHLQPIHCIDVLTIIRMVLLTISVHVAPGRYLFPSDLEGGLQIIFTFYNIQLHNHSSMKIGITSRVVRRCLREFFRLV
jgi:hypothetical protein